MYERGQGVSQDYEEAAKLYRLAADQGYALAQENLGRMYENGWGVPKDNVQAYMWYDLAASRYPQKERRDIAAKGRDAIATKMTRAQITEAKTLVVGWKASGETNWSEAYSVSAP